MMHNEDIIINIIAQYNSHRMFDIFFFYYYLLITIIIGNNVTKINITFQMVTNWEYFLVYCKTFEGGISVCVLNIRVIKSKFKLFLNNSTICTDIWTNDV